ncbi:hypothetical protein NE865_16615 [Phthorimaea operculella]|nr:hypothetical protein NE865_16615 [Phthorimaea operculella]
MSAVEEGEAPAAPTAEEIPAGNPEDIAKNPTALKEAQEEMATLDVLVCGQCHSAFHFVEEFKEHKEAGNCSGKSPVRDSNESKAQVWAFLLWKCSSSKDDNSWKLYQQWCRMPEAQRNAWNTAGANVQALSKFAHAQVTDDQQVPVQQTPQTATEKKPRGRPRKNAKMEESGEESDGHLKVSPGQKVFANKTAVAAQKKDLLDRDSVRLAQERVPPEERIARRTEREGADPSEAGEYVVEKILAKRFNPRRKQYEYLLKWEGYPHTSTAQVGEVPAVSTSHLLTIRARSEAGEYMVKILAKRFNPRRKQYEYLLKWEGYPQGRGVQVVRRSCQAVQPASQAVRVPAWREVPAVSTSHLLTISARSEAGEYVVEKILAKRFNPRRKQYEYLLKWEGYPH